MLPDHSSRYRAAAQKIAESETFSHSKVYQQLLLYLAEAALKDEIPKETTIAIEVFGKDESFNPAESTLVRVNIYNLRKKLEEYYLTQGKEDALRLRIPKGNYKVEFFKKTESAGWSLRSYLNPAVWVLLALLLLSLAANFWLWEEKVSIRKTYQPVDPKNALWSDILSSPKPVLIVLGDLFVFQEYSEELGKNRVIRDMTINSATDLTAFFSTHPAFEPKVSATSYTHLIKNNAYSLKDILPVLVGAQKEFDIQVMSRLTSEDLQQNNIIFIGLFKTLRLFGQYFQASSFIYTEDPDQQLLLTDETGQPIETYVQTGSPDAFHTDYGLVAKFPGPHDNFILLFAGFHDTGVLQSVKNLTNPVWLERIENRLRTQNDSVLSCFEILFRTQGIDRTEFDTEIVHLRSLPPDINIWHLDSRE
jgi:hypothetical protein